MSEWPTMLAAEPLRRRYGERAQLAGARVAPQGLKQSRSRIGVTAEQGRHRLVRALERHDRQILLIDPGGARELEERHMARTAETGATPTEGGLDDFIAFTKSVPVLTGLSA